MQLDRKILLLGIIICLFGCFLLIRSEKSSEDEIVTLDSIDWLLESDGVAPYLTIEVIGETLKITDQSKEPETLNQSYRYSDQPQLTYWDLERKLTNERQTVAFGSSPTVKEARSTNIAYLLLVFTSILLPISILYFKQ
ncbi:hypothetical protein IGI77_000778 [Enterococcus sp. DIV0213h]